MRFFHELFIRDDPDKMYYIKRKTSPKKSLIDPQLLASLDDMGIDTPALNPDESEFAKLQKKVAELSESVLTLQYHMALIDPSFNSPI